MSKMLEDYDHLLNIHYDRDYQIPFTGSESHITTAGRKTEKLDGIWRFAADVFDTFIRKKFFEEISTDEKGRDKPVDFDFDQWEQVKVPSNWNLQKEKYWFFEGTGIYTRKFKFWKKSPDERVFLRIGAANYESRVWLNGKLIARHRGGFTPYAVELTELLKEENRLIITVNNQRKLEQIPSINYDWFNYGGLFRSIELIRVPRSFIRDFRISLAPDGLRESIQIAVLTDGARKLESVRVEIPELEMEEEFPVEPDGWARGTIRRNVQLWSPDCPKLYKVRVFYGEDCVEEEIGFREIQTCGKKILLNGKEIFLKGVCCHEESLENGRALTEEEQKNILAAAKGMGCNIIRLSHYPHSERISKLADKMGILLWEEIPVYWALCFDNPDTYDDAENQLEEMIKRDYNRASVVIWGIGNENPDTDERLEFMKKLNSRCKTLDQTRLTAAACLVNIDEMKIIDRLCQYVDVVAINEYYGWYYRDYEGLRTIFENSDIGKPIVISETGADSVQGHFGDDEELFTENHQAKLYQKQFEIADSQVCGIFPWILFDFRSPVRLNPLQNSYNRKGLIGADKNYKKMAYYIVKDYYQRK